MSISPSNDGQVPESSYGSCWWPLWNHFSINPVDNVMAFGAIQLISPAQTPDPSKFVAWSTAAAWAATRRAVMNILGDPVANRRAETTFPGVTVKEAQKGQKLPHKKLRCLCHGSWQRFGSKPLEL
jgi:hypothetical protein